MTIQWGIGRFIYTLIKPTILRDTFNVY